MDKFENDLSENQATQTNQNKNEQKPSDDSNDSSGSSVGGCNDGWISKITNKAKNWCVGKKLEEFYPLTEEDASLLRSRSNREFT